MMFIVTLIALLIERFFDFSHVRSWSWYGALQRTLAKKLQGQSPYVMLAISIVVPVLAIEIIALMLSGILYGFVSLIFQLLVLLYCLGPQDLWADTFSCLAALSQGNPDKALEKLKAAFGINEMSDVQTTHRQLLSHIFIEANRRVFTVVFWYVILGPAGAVLARVVSYNSRGDSLPELSQGAHTVETVLEWAPARLITVIFALGGHFTNVIACWSKKVLVSLSGSDALLSHCGMAALGFDDQSLIPENGNAERDAISLLDRVFIIVLVIVAVLALI